MKQLFAFGFFLLSVLHAAAQRDSLEQLEAGLHGAYHLNQVAFSPRAEQEFLPGWTVALVVRHFNQRTVGVQAELGLEQRGWREPGPAGAEAYERRLTFATLQLLTQVAVGRGRIRPVIQAGPYVSAPIMDSENPEGLPPSNDSYYGQALPFRLNYGLAAGLGLYVRLDKMAFLLEGRATQGLSDLIKTGTLGVSTARRQSAGGAVTVFYRIW